ncbi:hypothetical protein TNCT_523331, partial [Trichonephila clavata]
HFPKIFWTVLYDSYENIRLPEVLCLMGIENAHGDPRMGEALEFLPRDYTDGEDFLSRTVTGDDTWVAHVN